MPPSPNAGVGNVDKSPAELARDLGLEELAVLLTLSPKLPAYVGQYSAEQEIKVFVAARVAELVSGSKEIEGNSPYLYTERADDELSAKSTIVFRLLGIYDVPMKYIESATYQGYRGDEEPINLRALTNVKTSMGPLDLADLVATDFAGMADYPNDFEVVLTWKHPLGFRVTFEYKSEEYGNVCGQCLDNRIDIPDDESCEHEEDGYLFDITISAGLLSEE